MKKMYMNEKETMAFANKVEILVEAALDPDKTPNAEQSINCLYKALDFIDDIKGAEND